MDYLKKVVIVTGGSQGIGRAISLELASRGAYVVVNQEPSDNAQENINKLLSEILSAGGTAIGVLADVSIKKDVEELIDRTVQEFGTLDLMVANAGICPFAKFDEISEELLDKVISVNQKGAFYSAQVAAEKMIELNVKGSIVFTSSVSAVFGGELQVHYCGTKGAVNQMMKSFAISLGKNGINCNAVQPGTVITSINEKELREDPELLNYFIKRTPMGKLALPEDIAHAVCFLGSNLAKAISGETLTIDGGMSVNLQ